MISFKDMKSGVAIDARSPEGGWCPAEMLEFTPDGRHSPSMVTVKIFVPWGDPITALRSLSQLRKQGGK